jgi:hypothetical protein
MFVESLFISSFAAITFMLASKLAEARFGEFHWWSKMASWGDQKVHGVMTVVVQKYQLYRKIAYIFIFEFLPAIAYHKTIELKDYLHKKYYTSSVSLRGEKRMLRSSGSVSEFLQNIKKEETIAPEVTGLEK